MISTEGLVAFCRKIHLPDCETCFLTENNEVLIFTDIDLSEVNNSSFRSPVTKDFISEYEKYDIKIQK